MTIDKDTIGTDLDILRDLINKSNDAIFVNDPPTGLFIFVNDKACASLEYDRKELLKMGVIDIETTLPDNFSWQAHVNELRQKGSLIMEGIHKRKNGTTFPVEANIGYVVLNTREYMVAIVRDITERKMAEDEIAERGAIVQQIMDTASVGIGLVNKHGRIVHANRRMTEMFGCTMEELIGSEYLDYVHPSQFETSKRNMLALLTSSIPSVELERLYRRKDGTEFWGHLSCRRFHDAHGNEFGLIGVIMDIDERKKGEEALRENQARLDLALQSAHMGVWYWDIIENRRYFDDLTCKLLGINAG
ncbi:MAG TPA: PAS domain S-box protein, partial [Thermodesulfovibrionales bacterium]|nr:PAS domain S-box protein [Thermodesulfovibrionales bacterium]